MDSLIFFTPDRPELQLQLREFAGDMEAKPAAAAQALPSGVMAVEFEVAEAGMERQMPWRHRQRHQLNARQLQADQLLQAFGGADLDLLGQLLTQGLRWQFGPHGEDEFGVVQQASVVQRSGAHAVLLLDDRQRHRTRLQHCAQGAAQGVFQELEGLA